MFGPVESPSNMFCILLLTLKISIYIDVDISNIIIKELPK